MEITLVTSMEAFEAMHEIVDSGYREMVGVDRDMLVALLTDHEQLGKIASGVKLYTTLDAKKIKEIIEDPRRKAMLKRQDLLSLLMDHSRMCAAFHPQGAVKIMEPSTMPTIKAAE